MKESLCGTRKIWRSTLGSNLGSRYKAQNQIRLHPDLQLWRQDVPLAAGLPNSTTFRARWREHTLPERACGDKHCTCEVQNPLCQRPLGGFRKNLTRRVLRGSATTMNMTEMCSLAYSHAREVHFARPRRQQANHHRSCFHDRHDMTNKPAQQP